MVYSISLAHGRHFLGVGITIGKQFMLSVSSTTWLLFQADNYTHTHTHWGSEISVSIVTDDSRLHKVLLPKAGFTVRHDSCQQASTHVSI